MKHLSSPIFPPPSTSIPTRPAFQSSRTGTKSKIPSPPSGLSINPSAYPLYSTSPTASSIRVLTAGQFAEIQAEYNSSILDEKVLLPWLHNGADVIGSSAAAYFGFGRTDAATVPK